MALTEEIKALPEGRIEATNELIQEVNRLLPEVQRALDALATAFGQFEQCAADAIALEVSPPTKEFLQTKRAGFIAQAKGIFV